MTVCIANVCKADIELQRLCEKIWRSTLCRIDAIERRAAPVARLKPDKTPERCSLEHRPALFHGVSIRGCRDRFRLDEVYISPWRPFRLPRSSMKSELIPCRYVQRGSQRFACFKTMSRSALTLRRIIFVATYFCCSCCPGFGSPCCWPPCPGLGLLLTSLLVLLVALVLLAALVWIAHVISFGQSSTPLGNALAR